MYAIEADGLRKTYPRGVDALRGVSFHVERGEVFALLGPNGAGKSTTVRILTTLSRATAGRAAVMGLDVASRPNEVRRRIGYVAQASGVDITATGRENLRLQGRLFHLSGAALTARVEELLALFDLADAADRLVRTYSGGMKRRLDVAMGLVHRPEVFFLDEPTTGLDPESRAVMWTEVRRLADEQELTILLTTHYLEEADRLARRVAIIDRGQVVALGTPDALKGSLRGDLVSIEVADESRIAEAAALLDQLPHATSVVREGASLHVQVEHGARALGGLVASLEQAGFAVGQASISRPSLDEVYLAMTGRSFSKADADAAPPARKGLA